MSAVRGKPDADPTWRPPLLLTQSRLEADGRLRLDFRYKLE